MVVDPAFWAGRRVLLTGHTGFKGAWTSLWLTAMGAELSGLSLGAPEESSLFAAADAGRGARSFDADVRDLAAVREVVDATRPEVVIHMAAQSLVRRSFQDPAGTYATNVMGTVHVLEAARLAEGVRVLVNVTSDKCYDNREQGRPFVEEDCMGGHDPYSSSKGCSELVTDAYRRSFSGEDGVRVASGRAGNVIGGGDWAEDRLIPDIMRGALRGEPIRVRNPEAIRPWQHVLNPVSGYLGLAQALWRGEDAATGWNFGPPPEDARPVRWIADRVTQAWPGELEWEFDPGPHPHEAQFLALDSTRAREQLGWTPRWDLGRALDSVVEWYAKLRDGADMRAVTLGQIEAFSAEG